MITITMDMRSQDTRAERLADMVATVVTTCSAWLQSWQEWVTMTPSLAAGFRDTEAFTAADAAEMQDFIQRRPAAPTRPRRTVPVDDDPTLY